MMMTTDPVALLKNEHKALLGQLGILERAEGDRGEMALVLKTLIRDCTVHFRRETLLFNELDTKLSPGGRSLHPLMKEHRDLKKHASNLLKDMSQMGQEAQSLKRMQAHLCEFATKFRSHIEHEEKIVFILAGTRLTKKDRQDIVKKMLVK